MQKSEVEDIKVIGDWLVHLDIDTNLPYKCINHEIEKTWEIHSKPVTGEIYYHDPNEDISVWSVPDELVSVLEEEPTLVADQKQSTTDENEVSTFLDNSFSGELKADPSSQTEQSQQHDVQAVSPDVITKKEAPGDALAKKEALAKATEIARVGDLVFGSAGKRVRGRFDQFLILRKGIVATMT